MYGHMAVIAAPAFLPFRRRSLLCPDVTEPSRLALVYTCMMRDVGTPNTFTHPSPETQRSRAAYLHLGVRNMEIGCGARVRDFDGRRYFYFWHYERTNDRSAKKEDYVGRVDSDKPRSDLLRRMAAYHRRAEGEFARRRAKIEGLIAAARTST